MKAISVSGLRKSYGARAAVEDVSFEVETGEIFGVIGPNGSGKTTTVECLQGLRRRDTGTVSVLGLDPETQRSALQLRIGSQLQESALPDRLKVREALELFAALTPHPADWRTLLEQWGLTGKAGASFASLSGGQRQRLFVALALVNRPEVVFLDEMTAGLDPSARREAWQLIQRVREQGTTVLLVTHFMDEAERLCDRVALLSGGRIVALDSPGRLASRGGRTLLQFSATGDFDWLREVPHVEEVRQTSGRVEVEGTGPVLALTAAALVERGVVPEDLEAKRPTLEDAFLRLTRGDTG